MVDLITPSKWAVWSKTIGLNVISIGVLGWQYLTGAVVLTPEVQLIGTALLNIVLRFVTRTPVTLLPPSGGLALPK